MPNSNNNKDLNTDIALIKSDLKNMTKFFGRVESSIEMMADLSKNVAVQTEVLEFTREKLAEVEDLVEHQRRAEELKLNVMSDRLEEYRRSSKEDHQRLADANTAKRNSVEKEILARIDVMEKNMHVRINTQHTKINNLENWHYYIMGLGGAIAILLTKLNWPNLFG